MNCQGLFVLRNLRVCTAIVLAILIHSPLAAQTWHYTNGPYPQCGLGVVVDQGGNVVVSTCTGIVVGSKSLTSWRSGRYAIAADELSTLNDGSRLSILNNRVLLDTGLSRTIYLGLSNSRSYGATWTSKGSILASVDQVGVSRSTDSAKQVWTTCNTGLLNTNARLLRADTAGFVYLATADGELYRSTSDGVNWTPQWNAGGLVGLLCVAPNGDVFVCRDSLCWRSSDHAASFAPVNLPVGSGVIHSVAFSGSWYLLATTRAGVLRSDDLRTWTELNQGIDRNDVSSAAFLADSTRFLATTWTGGLFYLSAITSSWTSIPMTIKPSDVIQFAKPNERRLFAATARHGIYRTDDKGQHWDRIHYAVADTVVDMACFRSSLVVATDHGLYHSANGGDSFDTLVLWPGHVYVLQVVVDQTGTYYAEAGGDIYRTGLSCYRSTNGGSEWEALQPPSGVLPGRMEVDSMNELLMMGNVDILGGNAFEPEVWKSKDKGNSWLKTETPYFVQNWGEFTSAPDGSLYVETQYGLFRSDDTTYAKWSQLEGQATISFFPRCYNSGSDFYSQSLTVLGVAHTTDRGLTWQSNPNPFQPKSGNVTPISSMILAFGGEIYIAEDGILRIGDALTSVNRRTRDVEQGLRTVETPSGEELLLTTSNGEVRLDIVDYLGRVSVVLADRAFEAGTWTLRVPASLRPGMYIARATTPTGVFTTKLLVCQ